ncbi:MAG: hypothetical protein ACTSUE_07960 [Promethearchaeota archaeon]
MQQQQQYVDDSSTFKSSSSSSGNQNVAPFSYETRPIHHQTIHTHNHLHLNNTSGDQQHQKQQQQQQQFVWDPSTNHTKTLQDFNASKNPRILPVEESAEDSDSTGLLTSGLVFDRDSSDDDDDDDDEDDMMAVLGGNVSGTDGDSEEQDSDFECL